MQLKPFIHSHPIEDDIGPPAFIFSAPLHLRMIIIGFVQVYFERNESSLRREAVYTEDMLKQVAIRCFILLQDSMQHHNVLFTGT